MLKSIVVGLGFAGLALWLGQRAGAGIKAELGGAHTTGGDDASSSFRAGIADENGIPDAMPAI